MKNLVQQSAGIGASGPERAANAILTLDPAPRRTGLYTYVK